MARSTQTHYSVLVRSRPGELAKLTGLLIREEVDIAGISMTSVGPMTSIEFLARDRDDLDEKLRLSGLKPRGSLLFQRRAPRRAGGLHALVRAIERRGVRILSLRGARAGRVILEVDRREKGLRAVAGLGFTPVR